MGNVEASVSPILQCLPNTTTSVPKKTKKHKKKKKKNRERERERERGGVVMYQEVESESGSVPWLGLPWLWLFFQIFFVISGHRAKKHGIASEKTEVKLDAQNPNDLKSFKE